MSPSTHSADVSQIQTDTAAILVDTGTTIPATISTVDTVVDAILVDTGTTIPATITTLQTDASSILVDTGTTLPATLDTGMISGSSGYKDSPVTTASNTYVGMWSGVVGGSFAGTDTFYCVFAGYCPTSTGYYKVYVNGVANSIEIDITTGDGYIGKTMSFTAATGNKITMFCKTTSSNTMYLYGLGFGGDKFASQGWTNLA